MKENKGKKKQKKKEIPKDTNHNEENKIDYLKEFDIYNADTNKIFSSPLSADNEKLLSEENVFNEENITKGLNDLLIC